MHLRLDRMKKVKTMSENARHFSEVSEYKNYFDVADYAQKSFNMFGGQLKNVTLRCKRDLLEQIIDRFTDKINIKSLDDSHFSFTAKALISDGLADWVMQFGKDVEVIEPQELREAVKKTAKEICGIYEK